MVDKTYRALLVEETYGETDDRPTLARLADLTESDLGSPDGTVWVEVAYSSLNFKDALALAGNRGVARVVPLVAGIDLVGTVITSSDDRWQPGDHVILNGDGIGENQHGGLAERAHVRGQSLVRLPETRSARWAAALGTAGFTAALSVLAVRDHGIRPADGPILVTGAAGGVGSIAISLLAHAGYQVVASSGRAEEEEGYLSKLGAHSIIDRQELGSPGKPLQKMLWAAAIDSVGSHTLANILSQTRYGGIVTACGLAQGGDLPTTVMPFILRAVTLRGINSVDAPAAARERAWNYLTEVFTEESLNSLTREITLDQVLHHAPSFAEGKVRGRLVVRVKR
ncbi:MDR family oxidoreductase [Lysinibacter sp. HNR]|uniref:MDR family oxidoreductase n=1 Tax=Lysinibacter sp. HNR TaxID=3031408 RepID=UPI00243593EB|nr:MDR family oxidoreductase [Lysinibacter sp. HNR]WGD37655.1 oxidoreductase [Lysinibacter sp. HNR]